MPIENAIKKKNANKIFPVVNIFMIKLVSKSIILLRFIVFL